MQVNPEDGPPEIYVTWSDPRMTDFENKLLPRVVIRFSFTIYTSHAGFNNTVSNTLWPDNHDITTTVYL